MRHSGNVCGQEADFSLDASLLAEASVLEKAGCSLEEAAVSLLEEAVVSAFEDAGLEETAVSVFEEAGLDEALELPVLLEEAGFSSFLEDALELVALL